MYFGIRIYIYLEQQRGLDPLEKFSRMPLSGIDGDLRFVMIIFFFFVDRRLPNDSFLLDECIIYVYIYTFLVGNLIVRKQQSATASAKFYVTCNVRAGCLAFTRAVAVAAAACTLARVSRS